MTDLIEALTIFLKYIPSGASPVTCEHDVMYVCVNPEHVTYSDILRLEELSFHASTTDQNFRSFRFGSC